MKHIGILGYGEVGRAIHKFVPAALIGDRDTSIAKKKFSFLHVCIPWQEGFISTVKKHDYDIAIIHSTVPVGTTKNIPRAVHSPIRGVHPFLYEGIKTHIKFIGSDAIALGIQAQEHLEEIGMVTKILPDSATTELGKILDTTYYGVCIDYHRYAAELCDKYGVEFEYVMTEMNKAYNKGYQDLGLPHFTRPTLYPPEGKIGGHCVRENARFLPKFSPDLVWDVENSN